MQAIEKNMSGQNTAGLPALNETGDQSRGPEKKFRAGTISATVWKNDRQKATGETFSYHSVSLERRYKDKDGNWKSASSFRLEDLPKVLLVVSEAYKNLSLNASHNEAIAE